MLEVYPVLSQGKQLTLAQARVDGGGKQVSPRPGDVGDESDDCGGGCQPDLESCYLEHDITWPCDPVLDEDLHQCGDSRCSVKRFYATEEAGWMHFTCNLEPGPGTTGDRCEYADMTGIADTCAHGYRCWNPEGTLDAGVCVPYCDTDGLEGPACAGECVQCSSSERGLCMTDCTGDECNVEEFC
jgi:hypothetical protein